MKTNTIRKVLSFVAIVFIMSILQLYCDPALHLRYFVINNTGNTLSMKYSIPKYDYNTRKEFYSDTSILLTANDTIEFFKQNRIGTLSQTNKYCDLVPNVKIYFKDSLLFESKLNCQIFKIDTIEKAISTGGKIGYTFTIKE